MEIYRFFFVFFFLLFCFFDITNLYISVLRLKRPEGAIRPYQYLAAVRPPLPPLENTMEPQHQTL